jgi:hypothetical protein
MPKPPMTLPAGVRITDKLTLGQFAVVFPSTTINQVLDACDRQTKRVRELPNEFVVFLVMMLSLFRDASHTEVLRCVAEGLSWLFGRESHTITGPSGISRARSRVGYEPFRDLFDLRCLPMAKPGDKGAYYGEFLLTALDGTLMNVDDSPKNQVFGKSTNQSKTPAGYPQARLVGLVELGTHAFFGVAIGGYQDSEVALAKNMIGRLTPKMLCLADRLFYSYDLLQAIRERGAEALFRVKRDLNFELLRTLPDGSHEARAYSSADRKRQNPLSVRVIEYKLRGSDEIYRLVTTIADYNMAPAEELAALYHERWEFENVLDEMKTHLNIGTDVLRSKTPELVKQEIYGMLMTHYVIRSVITAAADKAKLDPDVLSFIHAVRVIRRKLPKVGAFPPSSLD